MQNDIHEFIEQNKFAEFCNALDMHPEYLEAVSNPKLPDRLIHTAAHNGRHTFIEELIKRGVDIDSRGDHDRTALHYASLRSSTKVIKLLLESGADIEAEDVFRFTPLFAAIRNGSKSACKILIKSGAQVDLNMAICLGDLKRVQQFLDDSDAIKKARFPEWLVEDAVILWRGADMGLKMGDELTPEEELEWKNAEAITTLLLEKGADPLLAKSGLTLKAIQMSTAKCMSLLLKYGLSWKVNSSLSIQDLLRFNKDRDAMEAVLREYGWTPENQ